MSILTHRGRHAIECYQPIETKNEMQEVEVTWSTTPTFTRFAFVLTKGSATPSFKQNRELWRANQVHAEADFMLSIRFDSSVDLIRPNWSVVMRGRRLQIISVENWNEADVEIRLGCKEIVSYN